MRKIILESNKSYDIIVMPTTIEVVNLVEKYIKETKDRIDTKNTVEEYIKLDLSYRISDIISIGTSNEFTDTQVNKYIASKNNQGKNYYCYAKKDFSSDSCVLHESATSAFYCAIELLGKPKYIVVYRQDKNLDNVTN